MKLQVPFLQLPLSFDAAALAAEIEQLGESAWRPHPQGFAGNSAVPLIAVGGDPGDDAVRGPMRPTPHLARLPYLRQVLASFGATLGRSRLMRLSGQAEVTPHVDIDYYWREHIRVHVPIVTQPEVRFHCGDSDLHMAAGECWIFDTWRRHKVVNSDTRARIHLVADTVGGPGFWPLVSAGRVPGLDQPGWRARHVAPDGGPAELRYESVNLPAVMTPWEVREHLIFVLEDARDHPQLDVLHFHIADFCRRWRALWACYGEDRAGWPEYRAEVDRFRVELRNLAPNIFLHNGIGAQLAIQHLVCDVAVIDESRTNLADERSGRAGAAM
ncbi:aspartyl/asparaginyl beta-hydroxylase domain-containing protein [Tahibacter soli]|uniref:Aspartyl/asparaginyl beta-hydroxylase domain-containing protein n=1 Tax=Tahibacter soli TaxID=2983605 RepID=A0A9X4BGN7_9GAMM|nr:aspartyl/asparaginyl beta-hydroxylase domain-containing protein [Tahibacter soli]MDC8011308.1 aspartyl/asparaginyl beta-hydroxylase domain-containing protein [Tahibacter soli]